MASSDDSPMAGVEEQLASFSLSDPAPSDAATAISQLQNEPTPRPPSSKIRLPDARFSRRCKRLTKRNCRPSALTTPDSALIASALARQRETWPKWDGKPESFHFFMSRLIYQYNVDKPWGRAGTAGQSWLRILNCLPDSKMQRVAAFWQAGGSDGQRRPQDFFDYLYRTFGTVQERRKAQDRLRTLVHRDGQKFGDFLPEFEEVMLTAAGPNGWDDSAKLTWLVNSLSPSLRELLVTVDMPESYAAFVHKLQGLAWSFEQTPRFVRLAKKAPAPGPSTLGQFSAPSPAAPATDADGDIQMNATRTGKSASKTPKQRAKWVPKSIVNQRRTSGVCSSLRSRLLAPPTLVSVVVNRSELIDSLVDEGCQCYAAVSQQLALDLNVPIEHIPPRYLRGAARHMRGPRVTGIVWLSLELASLTKLIVAYVVPDLDFPIILGKPWLTHTRSFSVPHEARLWYGDAQSWVPHVSPNSARSSTLADELATAPHLLATTFLAELHRSSKAFPRSRDLLVRAVSLADVEKALQDKVPPTDQQLRQRLPPELHDFVPLFRKQDADRLNPHKPGIDHHIQLQPDADGKDPPVPFGPLYSMSREELLVLKKTLRDLLKKGFIRPSSSPAGAPVLFARKPGGGLRFCTDYRALNAITVLDRYPIPLLGDTLRTMARAKWFTKLDVVQAFHKDLPSEAELDDRVAQLIPDQALQFYLNATLWDDSDDEDLFSPLSVDSSTDHPPPPSPSSGPDPPDHAVALQDTAPTSQPAPPPPPPSPRVFSDDDLHSLWQFTASRDTIFQEVLRCVARGDRSFPPSLRLKVQIADCHLDARGRLRFRGRLWVPGAPVATDADARKAPLDLQGLDQLRGRIVQLIHDSHLVGHPGRDGTAALVARDFFWPLQ
ncbi:hypothetical protein CP532_3143 [Ophiocordyceps camponoti-leonardi (nom. inval.)]|nr:hypothetical protein CP532_3143 [Ophiocordyceps camponoti-leonardi (nom. inval.)]